MKVKTFASANLIDLGIEIEKFINQFQDITIISQSHSSYRTDFSTFENSRNKFICLIIYK